MLLRKGALLRHATLRREGVVIDWGVRDPKHRRYMLTKRDAADAVRVWTGQSIEVWPLREVELQRA